MAKTNANLIWKIAGLLRGPYQPNQYGDVILPFTILRRLNCILEPTRTKAPHGAPEAGAAHTPGRPPHFGRYAMTSSRFVSPTAGSRTTKCGGSGATVLVGRRSVVGPRPA